MANNKDLNKIAAAGLRIDKAYNPEEGTLTYGGYNSAPKSTPTSSNAMSGGNGVSGSSNAMAGGGNTMTGNNNGMTGVRNAMTSAGLDNSKIGWNGDTGYVTYNGQNFMKPANVTDGVSYASQADIDKAITGYMGTQGLSRVRDTLVSRGIDDSRIGWNPSTGMVTIDGRDAGKPETIIGDRSYAQANDINKLTDTAYANSGDPIQMVTDYVGQAGLQNAVSWADGKLTIGGIDVPVSYVQGNKAFARQSDIDRAIAQVKKNAGITGNQQVYDNWKDEYGDRINAALDLITNRDKWSYNPDTDPAYQAYRDMYTREGNRAYQDAYAAMAANTGGYGSSAGMTAAGQQLNYYMQQLGDRIPELEQNDYNRWYNDQLLNREAFNSLITAADNDYSKAYQANRDAVNDTNNANYYNYLRDIDARDYNRSVYESDRSFDRDKEVQDREWAYQAAAWDLQNALSRNQVSQSNIDTQNYAKNAELDMQAKEYANDDARLANLMNRIQYVLSKYSYGADYDKQLSAEDAAILGIGPKADGTYPTISQINDVYARLQAQQEYILQSKLATIE